MLSINVYSDKKSMSYRFRLRRFQLLNTIIDLVIKNKGRCTILDIGGTEYYWNINNEYINHNRNNIKIYIVNIDNKSGKSTTGRCLNI